MAIATVAVFNPPSPRRVAAASGTRVPPRVYTPFAARRLTRPMAVRPDADQSGAGPARGRLPLFGGRRDRSA
jgi:hypothetical protein